MQIKKNKNNKLKIMIIILILINLIGISTAWITLTITGKKKQEINAGVISLILNEDDEGIVLENAFPVVDQVGKLEDSYDFNIHNKSTIDLEYTVYLKNDTLESNQSRMNDNKIRTYLVKNNEEGKTENLSNLANDSNGRILDSGTIKTDEKIYYSLNLWINENVTEIKEGETYKAKIYVKGDQIVPKTLSVETEITGGSIIGEKSYVVEKGDTKTFTIKPNEGFSLGSVYCTNEQEAIYDEENNTLTLNNIERNSLCQVVYAYDYSCSNTNNFSECLEENLDKTGMIATEHDSTYQMKANTDYRFVGKDPNNYVYFNCIDDIDYTDKSNYNENNCELWRIIGSFDVDDGSGNYEKRVKLIRSEHFGTLSWSNKNSNDWSKSSLMKLFNEGDYYSRSGIYFDIGLTNNAKNKISDAKYYLGGNNTPNSSLNSFYNGERSNLVVSGYDTNWTGKIALMYLTDYAYASKNKECTESMRNGNCGSLNWLYQGAREMSLSHYNLSSTYLFGYDNSGNTATSWVTDGVLARPVVYLNANIQRIGGLGTKQKPYILE